MFSQQTISFAQPVFGFGFSNLSQCAITALFLGRIVRCAIFTVTVRAYNYAQFWRSSLISARGVALLSNWHLTATLFPQVAFRVGAFPRLP